ncbi:ATP synthase protein I2 [Acidihalobacter prosperus]|uniref:ATP synthase protein I2 n=2 Tax=Acidihalobacter prosperus TaxID=160660 RepID=A0A1A6C4T6_9GAMM|nr:ATP synthase protein I2 [Acidihalobacter prosperus]
MFQAGLVLIGVGLAAYAKGQHGIEAALYGGAVALANTLMLVRRIERVEAAVSVSAQRGMAQLYLSAVLRFVFVLAALAIGLGWFKLAPLPLIGTFVGAQAAYILISMRANGR